MKNLEKNDQLTNLPVQKARPPDKNLRHLLSGIKDPCQVSVIEFLHSRLTYYIESLDTTTEDTLSSSEKPEDCFHPPDNTIECSEGQIFCLNKGWLLRNFRTK